MFLKKIIEYGLYLLLFTLPWQTRWIIYAKEIQGGTSEYLTYSLYASDVLVVILGIFTGIYFWRTGQWRKKRQFSRTKSLTALAMGLFFAFSIAHAADSNLAMFIVLRLALAFFALRLLIVFADKTVAIFWLVLGLVPAAWLGVWQFLTQQTLANKWLGLANHIASEPGTSVIERYPIGQLPERWLRAYGSFDHPNMLGGALAIGLIFSLWLLAEWYYQKDKEKLRSLLYLIIASLAAGLVVSFSRGAWLGLTLGILFSLSLSFWRKRWSELRAWFVGVAIVVAIFGFFMIPYHSLATSRLTAQNRLEIKSTTERLAGYRQAGLIIKNNFLIGVGPGGYVPALQKLEPEQPVWYYQPTHSVYLLVLAEFGVVGLIMLIVILAIFVSSGQLPIFSQFSKKQLKIRKLSDSYNRFDLSLSAVMVSIATMMLIDHWWWSLHFGVFFFWLMAGLVILPKKTIEL